MKFSCKEREELQLHHLDNNYALYLASMWFNDINDFKNIEIATKRAQNNMNKFMYNPIPLDETTRYLFPNLKTLYIYSSNDNRFEDDENIIARKYLFKRYDMLYPHQYKALEEWTKLSCGYMIFDSTKHGWSEENSVFRKKILNKSKVCIVIENEDREIFGCYINSIIEEITQ